MWQTELLKSAEDNVITGEEVESITSSFISSALYGFVTVAIMTMGVKSVYGIIGDKSKKTVADEKKILEAVDVIW